MSVRVRLLIATLLIAIAGGLAARVDAAPTCTISFDGGASAPWTTAANWDLNRLPTTTDHVCIPAGQGAVLSSGTATVRTVQAAGSLTVNGGTLQLTDTAEDTTAATFTHGGGNIESASRIIVTGTGTWAGGDFKDGTLRVAPGATMTVSGGNPYMYSGTELEVAGTLSLPASNGINAYLTPAAVIHVLGTGVIRASGTGTPYVEPLVDNDGLVDATGGTFGLRGGGGESSGDFGGGAGTVRLTGGTQTLGDGAALLGGVTVVGGTLGVAAGGTATSSGANGFSGGNVDGPGKLSVTGGTFTVSGGDIRGGTVAIADGATMTVSGGNPYLYSGASIEVAGLLSLPASNGIREYLAPAPKIAVTATGVIRASGTGTPFLDPELDNDGLVEATGGTLSLTGGGGESTGDFGGGAGTVRLTGGTQTLGNGAALLGGVTVAGGTLAVTTGKTATASGANRFSSGKLDGPGRLSVTGGTFTVSGGDIRSGTIAIANGATMTVSGGNPYLYSGASIEVAGLLSLPAGNGIYAYLTPRSKISVTATGVIRASGTGTPFLDPELDNDGLVEATGGSLNLSGGGGESSGDFGGGAGTVRLTGGTQTLGNGAALLGGVTIAGGTLAVATGATATTTGANAMTSGTLQGAGTFAIAGPFAVSGGTMRDAGTTSVGAASTLTVNGGNITLAAGRRLEVAGTLAFTSDHGIFTGASPPALVHVLAGGVARKTAGSGASSIYPPLRNDGLVDSTSGMLELRQGAADPDTGDFGGDSATARASFEGGTHVLGAGARLLGHAEIGGGVVGVAAGATVPVSGDGRLTGGKLTGPGTVDVTGDLLWTDGEMEGPGTTRVASGATLRVQDCGTYLSDGRLLDVGGTMRFDHHGELYASGDPEPTIDVSGRVEFDDTDAGTCGDESGIRGTFQMPVSGEVERTAGPGVTTIEGVLDNDGAVHAAAGTLALSSDASVSHSGTFGSAGDAGAVDFASGEFVLDAGTTVAGNAGISFATVTLDEDATVTVGDGSTFRQTGGELRGGGELRVLGALDWTDGRQGAGTTTIEPGATATIGGDEFAFTSLEEGRAFVNRGALNVEAGELSMYDGASLLNAGTAVLADGAALDGYGFGGYGLGSLVHNTGLLRKPAGAGVAEVTSPLENDGTVEVGAGRLNLRGELLNASEDGELTGGRWVARGATLGVADALTVNGAHLLLDGDGAQIATVDYAGEPTGDALAGLKRNAGAGELEIRGGHDLALPGPFRNLGTVRIGAGSVTVAGEYRQTGGLTKLEDAGGRLTATGSVVRLTGGRLAGRGSAGPTVAVDAGVVEPGLDGTGALALDTLTLGAGSTVRTRLFPDAGGFRTGALSVAGAGALNGTLATVVEPGATVDAGDQVTVATFGARSGQFAALDGAAAGPGLVWSVSYTATSVRLTAIPAGGRPAAPASPPAVPDDAAAPAPTADPAPAEPVRGSRPERIDDSQLTTLGEWTRRTIGGRGYSVSSQPGAVLLRRAVRARRLAVAVATCRRCGTLAVRWGARRTRRVSLQGPRGRRIVEIARLRRPRSGTVRLRVAGRGRVAVDALIVR